jgi:signal transduction histidine kinase
VENNGVPIPAAEKEKIFERGFGKGTGWGLFLAREILAVTGMSIAETGGEGKGVQFTITLPPGSFRVNGGDSPVL